MISCSTLSELNKQKRIVLVHFYHFCYSQKQRDFNIKLLTLFFFCFIFHFNFLRYYRKLGKMYLFMSTGIPNKALLLGYSTILIRFNSIILYKYYFRGALFQPAWIIWLAYLETFLQYSRSDEPQECSQCIGNVEETVLKYKHWNSEYEPFLFFEILNQKYYSILIIY